MADENNIEEHEWPLGDGPVVRTGTSPQCQIGEHFACPNYKFDEGQPPLMCVCRCHLLPEVI
jgi:hypothetical protein